MPGVLVSAVTQLNDRWLPVLGYPLSVVRLVLTVNRKAKGIRVKRTGDNKASRSLSPI